MRTSGRGAAALAAGLLSCVLGAGRPSAADRPPATAAAAGETAPMTFEEVMTAGRSLGLARFSPDGGRLLVSLVRHDRPTGGAPWKLTGTETWIWELARDRPVRIGATDEAFLPAMCEPWSPAGRTVAGLVLRKGVRLAAAWDALTRRMRVFPDPPGTMCPTWVGERLVYPSPAPGLPDGASAQPAAERLLARWRSAWSEAAPQVTVHSNNPQFPAPEAPEGQLMLADPATGRSAMIALGTFHSLTPSPDGKLLAVVRFGAADPRALSRQAGRIGELQIYAIDGGQARLRRTVNDLDVDLAGLAWSPDGRRLLVGGRIVSQNALALLVIERDGGPARRLALPPGVQLGEGRRGAFSVLRPLGWMGSHPAFIAATREGRAAASDAGSDYGEGADRGFQLFVSAGGQVRSLTTDFGQSVTSFAAGPDGRTLVAADGALWALSVDRGRQRVSPSGLRVIGLADARPSYGLPPRPAVAGTRVAAKAQGPEGGQIVILNLWDGRQCGVWPAPDVAALSPRLDAVVTQRAEGWARRLRVEGRGDREIVTLNSAWRARPTGDVHQFDYVVAGRALRGWIVLPPGYRGGALPAVVWIYGGEVQGPAPPSDSRPGAGATPLFSGQLWAARGYAVIYPSTPLAAAADVDVPAMLAAEAVAAVDAAAAQGWVDPARVGLLGHSFGGFSVAAVLSRRSDRFRAGVALSGTYDFISSWGARQPLEALVDEDGYSFVEETRGFVEDGQIALRAPPFRAPAAYLRASPLFAVQDLRSPLLLMAGDLDQGATSLAQAERMYAALRRVGNPAVMVRYWGQDHVQDDPWAVRDQWARATAWFDLHLAPRSGAPKPSASVTTARRPAGPGRAPASAGPTTPAWPPS